MTGATLTSESYTYDGTGNRTNSGYTTGDNNRLLSDGTYSYTPVAVSVRDVRFPSSSYDAASRITGMTSPDGSNTLTYDDAGQKEPLLRADTPWADYLAPTWGSPSGVVTGPPSWFE